MHPPQAILEPRRVRVTLIPGSTLEPILVERIMSEGKQERQGMLLGGGGGGGTHSGMNEPPTPSAEAELHILGALVCDTSCFCHTNTNSVCLRKFETPEYEIFTRTKFSAITARKGMNEPRTSSAAKPLKRYFFFFAAAALFAIAFHEFERFVRKQLGASASKIKNHADEQHSESRI